MPPKDSNDAFLQKLRSTFRVEAEEHVQAISSALLALERDQGDNATQLEEAFRHFHSLKGAARAVNIFQIEKLCQASESILERWKNTRVVPRDQKNFDALHAVINGIGKAIPDVAGNVEPIPFAQMTNLMAPFDRAPAAAPTAPIKQPESKPVTAIKEPAIPLARKQGTVRVATEKLDALLTQSEELLAIKMSLSEHENKLKDLAQSLKQWEKKWSKVQPLATFAEKDVSTFQSTAQTDTKQGAPAREAAAPHQAIWDFLEWNSNFMRGVQEKLRHLTDTTGKDTQSVKRLVDDFLSISKQLVMLPFSSVADVIPKVIRDLSRDQAKRAELKLLGAEMEMDKRILEELKDPLIHLVRNCVDHGIESPDVRTQAGKSPHGKITIQALRTNNNTVQITVSDDGAGIDTENLKAAALRRGATTASEAAKMTAEESHSLIFGPGLTTSSTVTEISGRGMGLPVVQQAMQRLGGRISVESTPHTGTTFTMTVPLIFGTINGLLVRAEDQMYIFGAANIERVIRVDPADIKSIQERDWLTVGTNTIPYARLGNILQLQPKPQKEKPGKLIILLVSQANESVAFGVEEVLSVQELLVKPLKKPLLRIRNILGASTLASGRIVPILNVQDLLSAARQANTTPPAAAHLPKEPQFPQREKKILLAEDSMTSRMLLKGILETAGYSVQTAVDGVEAITLLRIEDFDLIISDVEMPRMNGFDLTAEIRKDRRLTEKPIVLVSALSSREDRERGIDAGANAYIVKSSFEQSNLLDTVRRLI